MPLDWNNASRLGSTFDPFTAVNNYQVNVLSDTQKQGSTVRIFLGARMYILFSLYDGSFVIIIYHPLRPASQSVHSQQQSRSESSWFSSSRTLELGKWRLRESHSGPVQSDLSETRKFLVHFKECTSKEFYSNGKFNMFVVYNNMCRRGLRGVR